MKKTLLETASAASTVALLAALPATAMAHSGLDHGSALMLRLHALTHTLGDHPFILIALAGAMAGVYSLYRRSNASHNS